MGSSEIKINYANIRSQKNTVALSLSGLRLGNLDAKDTGNSAAIKEFVSVYNEFSSVINDYISVMNGDLERVMSATGQINEVDRLEGILMQGLQSNIRFQR